MIREAKTKSWREVVEDAVDGGDDSRKMWKLIKSLHDTPDTNSPNEVIIHKSQCKVRHIGQKAVGLVY